MKGDLEMERQELAKVFSFTERKFPRSPTGTDGATVLGKPVTSSEDLARYQKWSCFPLNLNFRIM